MTYKPEDYQVISEREYADGGKAFDVRIKGADFIVYRVMNRFQPTSTFKFNQRIGYTTDETGIITGTVEIDWDTCTRGMLHLADQMGLKLIPAASVYSISGRLSQFEEGVE